MAFSAFWKDDTDDAGRRFCRAIDRAAAAHRVVEAGLSEARAELIGAMWRHYPAAARRKERPRSGKGCGGMGCHHANPRLRCCSFQSSGGVIARPAIGCPCCSRQGQSIC
jgi:hypothetical protein